MTYSDNPPPSDPRRRIELVPLFASPNAPHVPRPNERPPVDLSPLPPWPAPSVRTTSHHGPRPAAHQGPAPLAIAPGPGRDLRPAPSAGVAGVVDAVPVRQPKAPRPDPLGRPMDPSVAAAIGRVTDNVTELRPRNLPVPGTGLVRYESEPRPGNEIVRAADVVDLRPIRSRIQIVPLISQTPRSFAPLPQKSVIDLDEHHDAMIIDLREPRGHRNSGDAPTRACPACAGHGVIDIIDNVNGMVHLSCPKCFRMWTERTREGSVPTDH